MVAGYEKFGVVLVGGFFGVGDEDGFGVKAVLEGVQANALFAFSGARTGGVPGVFFVNGGAIAFKLGSRRG